MKFRRQEHSDVRSHTCNQTSYLQEMSIERYSSFSLCVRANRFPTAVFLPLMNEMRRGGGENTPSSYNVSRNRLVLSKQRIRD